MCVLTGAGSSSLAKARVITRVVIEPTFVVFSACDGIGLGVNVAGVVVESSYYNKFGY